MNKLRFTRSMAFVLLAIIVLSACGINEKEAFNSFSDRDGLNIDLAWTTHNGSPAALAETDLDLDILSADNTIFSSYNVGEFEHVKFADVQDGVYTVKVTLSEISKSSDYTLRVKSASSSKEFKISGRFKGTEGDDSSVEMLKIKKDGKLFTLTTL